MAEVKKGNTGRTDAGKAAQLEEQIRKEMRMQMRHLVKQEEAGLIIPRAPTPPRRVDSQRSQLEAHTKLLQSMAEQDPDAAWDLNLSRNMSSGFNPGYLIRDPCTYISTTKTDFIWDAEEIRFIREFDSNGKKFNRKRDDVSNYAEESAKFKHLLKKTGA